MKKCKIIFSNYNNIYETYGNIHVFTGMRRVLPRWILSHMYGDIQIHHARFWDVIQDLQLNGYNLTVIK